MATLVCDGSGGGMIDEMQSVLDDGKVQFGLVNMPVGSGTFARNKFIFVQWAGEGCSGMKRAKAMQRVDEVQKVFGHSHASYSITTKDECTLDKTAHELKSVFVSDSGEFSAADLKKSIEAKIKANQAAAQPAPPTDAPKARQTAKDLGLSEDAVLAELRKNVGKFNWCLLEPSPAPLKMFDAGSKSIEEMHSHLQEDKVLYGLLRVGFGKGAYRRTKWVCITFVGEQVKMVSRGKQVAVKGEMEAKLKPYSVSIEAHGKDEATIEAILDKIKSYVVSDDIDKSEVTVQAFQEALEEEVAESAKFFGDDDESSGAQAVPKVPVTELIAKIKSGELLWGCFSFS